MITRQSSCTDINEQGLMPVDEAKQRILSGIRCISGLQRLPIEQTCRRTLGKDIISSINVPAHTNSAVDGYAFSVTDKIKPRRRQLQIVGAAYAGKPYTGPVGKNQCVRIMTGARLPEDVNTVIMQEHTTKQSDCIIVENNVKQGANVRYIGEDIQKNHAVLQAGKWLTPADIGLLASLGIIEIDVRRTLKVAIASTGDEIIDIGAVAGKTGIYDSNRYSLIGALSRADIEIIDLGIIEDNTPALLKKFTEAAAYADIIISTGGVSVGDADYTKIALRQSGTIDFWKIAIKPGRPLAFGTIADKPFFGLPGNPVAVLVTFYQFVLPALEKMLGITNKPIAPTVKAKLLHNLRKKPGRTEIQRGILEQAENGEWTVRSSGKQGSGILSSMCSANAFIILPHDRTIIREHEWVMTQPFSSLF